MRRFVTIAAVMVVVVLTVVLVAPMALRGQVSEVVRREAAERLRARLDFERLNISLLRYFPSISIELKGLTIVGEGAFAGDTILAAKRVSVVVDLLSMLRPEGARVSKVAFSSPSLCARKLSDGAVSWDLLKPVATADSLAGTAPATVELSLRDIRISDATICYDDDSTKVHFATSGASLRLRGDLSAPQADLDLRLAAKQVRLVSGGVPLLRRAEAELSAIVRADRELRRFTFLRNTFSINAVEVSLKGWMQALPRALALDLTADCSRVQFKELLSLVPAFYTSDFRNMTASGDLSLSFWVRGKLQGRLLPAFELKTEVRNANFQYSSLPKSVTDIQFAARVFNPGGVMDQTLVDVSKFGFKMGGNTLSASLYATHLISDPVFRAAAAGRVNLGEIKKVYPLKEGEELGGVIVADVHVAGRMSDFEEQHHDQVEASGTFVVEGLALAIPALPAVHIRRIAATLTPQSMTLGDFGATVGRSDVSATGQLTGYIGYLLREERLSGRLYVKSDLLDLNEIQQAAWGGEQSDSTAVGMRPLELPHNLNLSLSTDLHEVLFGRMNLAELTGEMRVEGGELTLYHLAMQAFGGKATASGVYSTVADPLSPTLQLSLGLTGASFAKTFDELVLAQQLAPLFAKTEGNYSLALALTTTLDGAMSPELGSFEASGELESTNFRIPQSEVLNQLAKTLGDEGVARLNNESLAIRFAVQEGCVVTEPFDLKMGGFTITLSGSAWLDQRIDYTARVALPTQATGGVPVSVGLHLGGTTTTPTITLGAMAAVEEAVKNQLHR